jgi:hypothetical protein
LGVFAVNVADNHSAVNEFVPGRDEIGDDEVETPHPSGGHLQPDSELDGGA